MPRRSDSAVAPRLEGRRPRAAGLQRATSGLQPSDTACGRAVPAGTVQFSGIVGSTSPSVRVDGGSRGGARSPGVPDPVRRSGDGSATRALPVHRDERGDRQFDGQVSRYGRSPNASRHSSAVRLRPAAAQANSIQCAGSASQVYSVPSWEAGEDRAAVADEGGGDRYVRQCRGGRCRSDRRCVRPRARAGRRSHW